MGIFRRLSNLVSANVHDVLDWCENPESLLKQSIRNMEQTMRTALTAAARVIAHEHVLRCQQTAANSEAVAWRVQAEAAVQRGDDSGARQALQCQHESQHRAEALAAQHQEAATLGRTLRRQLDRLRLRLHDARRQRDMLVARQRAAEARRRLLRTFSDFPVDSDSFREFDRLAEKVQRAEAEVEAFADLAHAEDNLAARRQEAEFWVERELRGLRKQSQSSPESP